MNDEIIIPLSWGGSLRCGKGKKYAHGGYVRLCDENGVEVESCYWDKEEWASEPERVMGEIFAAADVEIIKII